MSQGGGVVRVLAVAGLLLAVLPPVLAAQARPGATPRRKPAPSKAPAAAPSPTPEPPPPPGWQTSREEAGCGTKK